MKHRPSGNKSPLHLRLIMAALMAGMLSLVPGVAAAKSHKVELCHMPQSTYSVAHTLRVDEADVNNHLAHGDSLGACPPTAAQIDPPSLTVDPALQPPVQTIAGINGGPSRPLARILSSPGLDHDFNIVSNEVFLVTDNEEELADFQSRWPSELLQTTVLPPVDPAGTPTKIHLLSVDASSAKRKGLEDKLAELMPTLHGVQWVSDDSVLDLLALVAKERLVHKLRVGINPLLQSADFADRQTTDAMDGENIPVSNPQFIYTTNAFEWPYLERNPNDPAELYWPADTGAADAIRAVEAAGMLGNRIGVMVADGGFFPNQDFPDYTMLGPIRTINPDPGGCGRGAPPTLEDDCGTHGTHVVMAGFARPDNAFGSFGPGGAVSELTLVQSPAIDVMAMIGYIFNSLPDALSDGASIVNVSASVSVAAGWCFIACEPLDLVSQVLRDHGIIFVAAAGNDNEDVDKLDEFCLFEECAEFEEAAVIPCELDHVICVGATNFLNAGKAGYSNFASGDEPNSIDLFAPGNLYSVDAIKADSTVGFSDDLQLVGGTSYASPFVAGVLALTWAADPGMSVSQVEACVIGSAHDGAPFGDELRVDVLGAVSCALGGTHPWVGIEQPANGTPIERGVGFLRLVADSDDYEDVKALGAAPVIRWSSSIDGDLGTSNDGARKTISSDGLSLGTHAICAEVSDSSSKVWRDCTEIEVTSASPSLTIVSPIVEQQVYRGEILTLAALVSDPDSAELSVEWRTGAYTDMGWDEMNTIATGAVTSFEIPDWMVSPRYYLIRVRATDETGVYVEKSRYIQRRNTGGNQPPRISIEQPTLGQTFESSDGGSVRITLVATAEDDEDGPIDFEEIDWRVIAPDDIFSDPLPVTRTCLVYDGSSAACLIWGPWTFELSPVGSNTRTEYKIYGRVQDSDGAFGESIRLVIYVSQLII